MGPKEFLEKREKWLNEVSDQCHEYALKIAIPHYGYFTAYSYENSAKIGKNLSIMFK